MAHSLDLLTGEDLALLREKAEPLRGERGTVLVRQGEAVGALFLIRRGFVRVEQDEVVVARLGPGEVFGEMSFLEDAGASASAIAEGDVEIDRVPAAVVRAILSSRPEMATRFFQSLAIRLSSRLRATSRMLTRLRRGNDARLAGQRAVRVGEITERQVPPELVERLRRLRAALAEAEAALRASGAEVAGVRARVAAELDAMVELLREYTASARVLEIGYADPLAFRDDEHIRAGIGAVLFRECFPVLMLSNTMGRLYARPRAVAEDFETVRAILAAEPFGDGALGPTIDAWFLARPICRARRAARAAVTARLRQHLGAGAARPAQVCDLACGTAAALLDAMAEGGPGRVRATCIDTDSAALREVAAEAAARALGDDVALICADVLELGDAASDVRLEPQDALLLVDLLEYLEDDDVVALLDWTWQQLTPGGIALATTLAAGHPDAPLTTHLLEWQLACRDRPALARLVAASRFAGRASYESLGDGAGSLLTLAR